MIIFLVIVMIVISSAGFIRGLVKTAIPLVSAFCSFMLYMIMKEWLFSFLLKWTIFSDGHILSRVVVILLIFILASLGFRLLFRVTKLATKLPVIHGADKLFGLILGFVEANLVVWTIFYIASINNGVFFGVQFPDVLIGQKYFFFLYEHNFVQILVSNLII